MQSAIASSPCVAIMLLAHHLLTTELFTTAARHTPTSRLHVDRCRIGQVPPAAQQVSS